MSFLVLSLPRSRSAWIAKFLSYGGRRCGHDIAPQCVTVQEFVDRLDRDYCGSVETGAVVGWRAILKLKPDLRIATVRRPVQQVYESLARFGLGAPEVLDELRERDAMLDEVERLPGTLSFTFDGLKHPWACQNLFELYLDMPFDWEWWESLAAVNVQVNVPQCIQYLIDNRERIAALKRDAQRIVGGVTIKTEAWPSVWPEIDALFAEHFGEVEGDLAINRPYRLNEAQMRALDDSGHLHITTARVGGDLAGYCMWMVSEDVESAGMLIAQHGPWFVRRQFASLLLGPKLFDASIESLRKRGVKCAFPHHRLMGRGRKLGAFFKRRGAVEIQHTYSLWLGEGKDA